MSDLRTSETHDEPRKGAVIAFRHREDRPNGEWRIHSDVVTPHAWSEYEWRELEDPPAPPVVPQPWTRSDGQRVRPYRASSTRGLPYDEGKWWNLDSSFVRTPEDARNVIKSCEEVLKCMEADNA